jgi:hypothetical protein
LIGIGIGQQAIRGHAGFVQQKADARIAAQTLFKFQHLVLLRQICLEYLPPEPQEHCATRLPRLQAALGHEQSATTQNLALLTVARKSHRYRKKHQ